jgi:LmbE family N-acetylglucosaminyl deacetylase
MELCHDDMAGYSAAVGVLAVHSAISYSDAVQIKLSGKRTKPQDHQRAVRATKAACQSARIESRGVAYLEKLLSAKTDVSYGDARVDNRRIEFLYQAARAFRAWAESILGGRR